MGRETNTGSSGGAVINTQGEALGIATSGLSRLAGLSVPASTVNRVVNELLTKGHISRGYLGLGLQPIAIPDALTCIEENRLMRCLLGLRIEPL